MLTMQEAIRKMTSLPASRLSLSKRGTLLVNNWADIVVFDPQTIEDKSTFNNPHQYAEGIKYVLVNGYLALQENVLIEDHYGKIVRNIND